MNLFENYFLGKLSAEDQQILAEKRKDPSFEAEFLAQQKIFRAIRYQGAKELKAQLRRKEENLMKSRSRQGVRRAARRILQLAAVLFLSLTVYLVWTNSSSSPDYLSDYFTPALNTALANLRGDQRPGIDTPLENALQAYNQKDFQTAIEQFHRIDQDTTLEVALFYEANAQLTLDNSSAAIPLLQTLLQKETDYHYQSLWLLSLAYLSDKQPVAARSLLEEVAQLPGPYQNDASQIQLQLN